MAARKCRHLPPPGLEQERACTLSPCPGRPPLAAAGPPRGRWFTSPWSQVGRASGAEGWAGEGPAPDLGRWLRWGGVPTRVSEPTVWPLTLLS